MSGKKKEVYFQPKGRRSSSTDPALAGTGKSSALGAVGEKDQNAFLRLMSRAKKELPWGILARARAKSPKEPNRKVSGTDPSILFCVTRLRMTETFSEDMRIAKKVARRGQGVRGHLVNPRPPQGGDEAFYLLGN